jgi:hypothetical protein
MQWLAAAILLLALTTGARGAGVAAKDLTIITNINGTDYVMVVYTNYARLITASNLARALLNSAYEATQFTTNSAGQLVFKSGATTTNTEIYSPALKFSVATGGPLVMQEGNDGIGFYDGITELFNINQTNCYFTAPLFVITPTEDSHAANKFYVDTLTNWPYLTATNGFRILTNGTLYFDRAGYGDPSNYEQGRLWMTPTGFNLGTFRAGSGSAPPMQLRFWVDGTNNLTIGNTGSLHFNEGAGKWFMITNAAEDKLLWMNGSTIRNAIYGMDSSGFTMSIQCNNELFELDTSGMFAASYGSLLFANRAINQTNFGGFFFGARNSNRVALVTTNGNFTFTRGNDANGTAGQVVLAPVQGTNYIGGDTVFAGTNTFDSDLRLRSAPSFQYLTSTNNNDGNGTNFVLDLNWNLAKLVMTNHVYFTSALNGPTNNYAKTRTFAVINNSGANYVLTFPTGFTNVASSPSTPLTITNGTVRMVSVLMFDSNTNALYDIR